MLKTNQSSSFAFEEASSYWSAPKSILISRIFICHHTVFWLPLVSIGQHFVNTRVVHLPKRTETSLIPNRTEAELFTKSNLCGSCIAAIAGSSFTLKKHNVCKWTRTDIGNIHWVICGKVVIFTAPTTNRLRVIF